MRGTEYIAEATEQGEARRLSTEQASAGAEPWLARPPLQSVPVHPNKWSILGF